jgi:hypothetical protein
LKGNTKVEGADAIGESLGAVVAEISGEEGEPRGEKLRRDSELRWLVSEEERVSRLGPWVCVVAHGCD